MCNGNCNCQNNGGCECKKAGHEVLTEMLNEHLSLILKIMDKYRFDNGYNVYTKYGLILGFIIYKSHIPENGQDALLAAINKMCDFLGTLLGRLELDRICDQVKENITEKKQPLHQTILGLLQRKYDIELYNNDSELKEFQIETSKKDDLELIIIICSLISKMTKFPPLAERDIQNEFLKLKWENEENSNVHKACSR